MSERTVKVWIGGKLATILESSLSGVLVQIPDGVVKFQNAGEPAPGSAAELEGVSEQEQPQPTGKRRPVVPKEFSLGMTLHNQVSYEKWCVTLEDLKELRDKVKEALKLGMIQPTIRDPFDPKDRVVGPNIHTVTEQFIKKVTAKKGGMSWALMKHKEGLECDLFITHCWDEGIFEFLDKVIVSWPRGSQHAYCCMLANPQNLDVGALIGDPSDSPFARALRRASKMMVVPNSKTSIYTRLWCAYEAYTAYEEQKFIFTARAPLFSRSLVSLGIVAAFAACGVAHRYCSGSALEENTVMWVSPFVLALMTMMARRSAPEKFVFCCIGARDAMCVATGCIHQYFPPAKWIDHEEWSQGRMEQAQAFGVMYMLFTAYFFLSAADHVSAKVYQEGADQLEAGYRGSVKHATCSTAADEKAILTEMQGKEERVDKAIRVLIDAGMSTERLRDAYDHGVEVKGVAHIQWAPTVVALIWTCPFMFASNPKGEIFATVTRMFVRCDLATSAFLVLLLVKNDLDQRAVAVACLQKLHLLLPTIVLPLFVVQFKFHWFHLHDMFMALAMIGLVTKPICACFMKMELSDIACRFGKDVAQFLVTYGYGLSDRADSVVGQALYDAEVELSTSFYPINNPRSFGWSRTQQQLSDSIETDSFGSTVAP